MPHWAQLKSLKRRRDLTQDVKTLSSQGLQIRDFCCAIWFCENLSRGFTMIIFFRLGIYWKRDRHVRKIFHFWTEHQKRIYSRCVFNSFCFYNVISSRPYEVKLFLQEPFLHFPWVNIAFSSLKWCFYRFKKNSRCLIFPNHRCGWSWTSSISSHLSLLCTLRLKDYLRCRWNEFDMTFRAASTACVWIGCAGLLQYK